MDSRDRLFSTALQEIRNKSKAFLLKRDTTPNVNAASSVVGIFFGRGHLLMETDVLEQAATDSSGCRSAEPSQEQGEYSFSKELISFSLYGKIPRKSKRPWNESLSAKISEVQQSFKNIPSMLYFSPSSVAFDGIGVYAAESLPKGTMLGPYFGKAVHKEQIENRIQNDLLWEVYQDSSLAYFIDASDPKYGNWMNFIQCARNQQEQNLKALQYSGSLYFEGVRDIVAGEELLVWYDDMQYDIYMGIPVGYRGKAEEGHRAAVSASTRRPEHSRPSSGNGEDPFLSSVHYLRPPPTIASGSRMSDTSSASTDDSGISLNFEQHTSAGAAAGSSMLANTLESCSSSSTEYVSTYHSGGSASTLTSNPTSGYPPTQQSYASPREVEALTASHQSATLPTLSSDSLQQRYSDLKPGVVTGPRFSVIDTPLSVSTSTWSPGNGHGMSSAGASPGAGIATNPKQQQQAGRETWPAKAAGKPNLLYGMFSKTDDGTRWQCEECKRVFSSQGSLRAHARIHTGERPYQCQYCFRTFCQASTLRSHERLHTGEKPYKCEHCGRAFTQSAGLRSHLKTHRYDS